MSDTKSGNDWSSDWQALQRQYWSAWSDLTRNLLVRPPDAATPWHEGSEQWSRMFGSAGVQSEAAERLMSSAKSYLTLMQSMLSFAAGAMRPRSTCHLGSHAARRHELRSGGVRQDSWFRSSARSATCPASDSLRSATCRVWMPPHCSTIQSAKALREISGQGLRSFEQLASALRPMLQQMHA